jgi:uncharacterized protein YdaU (DUF1376 family)
MAVGDDGIPPWVDFVLDRVDKQFDNTNSRIDRLVTQDAFRQEQDRVNQRLTTHDRELGESKAAIQAEANARATENRLRAEQENAQKDRIIATQKQTQWQWLLIIAGPIIGWVVGGILPPIGGP